MYLLPTYIVSSKTNIELYRTHNATIDSQLFNRTHQSMYHSLECVKQTMKGELPVLWI